MIQAIDEQKPDQVIHLGDLISDAEEISYLYPKLPVCMVPGNCDGWTTVPSIKQITLQGRSILLSHGHLWGVKSGCDAAIARARAAGADILLFGHTHQPLTDYEDGLYLMNPGSLGYGGTYGYVDITPAGIVTNLALDLPRRPGGDR